MKILNEFLFLDRLEEGILSSCVGAVLNGDKLNRLPNTTNISLST